MAEYEERRRGPSFVSILIAVLLAGILLAMIAGLLMLRTTAQTVKGEVDRVREWGEVLLKEATPTIRPNPATIIREIETLSRLETVSYSVEKVITVEKNQHGLADLLGLDEKLLFVAHGKVIAGVDLSKLNLQDITITDDNIVIVGLPEAEVFISTLDNKQSYVYDHARGVLNRVFEEQSDLETLARQAAEDTIEEAALEDGILDIANTNAESYMRAFLMAMGFDQVIFALPGRTDAPAVTPTPG
jgi:hypothetical protein